MTGGRKPKRRRLFYLSAAALMMVIVFGVWLILRKGQPIRGPDAEAWSAVPAVSAVPPAHRPPLPSLPAKAPAPDASPLEYADDGVPIMPPGPNDPHPNTFVHPHPITPAHMRIFRENALLYQLNEAMDGKEVPRLRKLLKEYRGEYPEDPQEMQDGYALIADCIEHPGDATIQKAAQQYFNEKIASTLRRFVRRHCLPLQN